MKSSVISQRLSGLDSLRGLAALVVVISHALLLLPVLGNAARIGHSNSPEDLSWWLAYTPLALVYSGGIAVFIFFVLSGFVLALPGSRRNLSKWISYYPKRLVRLYVPVMGAVLFAMMLILLFPREAVPAMGWWQQVHDVEVYPLSVVREALLLFGTGRYNSVLWSLVWEVLFSLLLPIYLLVTRRLSRRLFSSIIMFALLSGIGSVTGVASLTYLPMFAIGVHLATAYRDSNSRLLGLIRSRKSTVLISLLLMLAYYAIRDYPLSIVICLISCTGIVISCIGWESNNPVLGWLGSRSFSLYLVHEPILVSLAFALGVSNVGITWMIAAVLVPVVTEVFYSLIEKPSISMSKWSAVVVTELIEMYRGIRKSL